MGLPQNLLIVSVSVAADVETEWNRWYDKVHLPEILSCPGFRSGQRYVAEAKDGQRRYITIYELDAADALESQEFQVRRGWGPFTGKVQFETLKFTRIAQTAR